MKELLTKSPKTVLIALYLKRSKDPQIPLAHNSILTKLQENNINIDSIVINLNNVKFNAFKFVSELIVTYKNFPMLDIALGVYVWNDKHVKNIIKILKNNGFKGRIILGGPQISYTNKNLKNIYPEADVFIRGYAEDTLLNVIKNNSNIDGVYCSDKADNNSTSNVNLRELPSPWIKEVKNINKAFIRWETSRGCRYNCSFCQHRNPGKRPKISNFSFDRISKEIQLFSKYKVNDIAVLDPVFNNNEERAIKILNEFIKNKFKGRISLQVRGELISNRFLDIIQKLNIRLELGLQTIHLNEMKAIKRKNNLIKLEYVINEMNKRSIDYEISLIYGLPNQTIKSFEESINWCIDLGVHKIKAFPLLLLRGTELYESRDKYNFLTDKTSSLMVQSSDSFDYQDWKVMRNIANDLNKLQVEQNLRIIN